MTCAEVILNEPAHKRHVAQYRCRGQATCLAQVLLVGQHATLGLGLLTERYRLGADHRLKAQEIDEMPERGRVTRVKPCVTGAVSQILRWMIGADAVQPDPFLLEPSAEIGCQPNPTTDRRTSISLCARRVRKRLKPFCKRTFRRLRQNHLLIDDIPHGGLLPLSGLMGGVRTMSPSPHSFTRKSGTKRHYKT